jgi:hypothetical protein
MEPPGSSIAAFPATTPEHAARVKQDRCQRDLSERHMHTSTPPPDLPVSIADLVSRDLPMHWSEAVAIVGELCTVLTANSPSEAGVPDAADIFITSAGAVVLRQGAWRKDDTTPLGYILHELLDASSTPTPVPLRLFVSTSISSSHASVSAFAGALAYYERPGRTELIRAVHGRALAAQPAETHRQSEPVQKDQDQKPEKKEPKPSRRRRFKAVVAGAAAAVLLCAVGAGVWFGMGPQRTSSSTAFGAVAAQARSAAEKLGATVRETLGIPSGSEQVAELPATPPSPQKPRRVRRPIRAAASQPLKSSILDALGFSTPLAAVEPTSPLLRETMAAQPGSALMAEDAGAPALRETEVVVVEDSIYSNAAVDVLPPVLLYPHLPPTAPEVRSLPGNSMELLIAENGAVERVKLIAGPLRMADMMLLSSAKMWKFRPALKDGRSVRYRLVLNWTVTPR